jgi:cytochrome c biogenesis protein CcdA
MSIKYAKRPSGRLNQQKKVMKKTLCLIATIYLAFMTLMIPAMFFMFTDPTATNLALASLLTAVSGLASYNYFLTYKSK